MPKFFPSTNHLYKYIYFNSSNYKVLCQLMGLFNIPGSRPPFFFFFSPGLLPPHNQSLMNSNAFVARAFRFTSISYPVGLRRELISSLGGLPEEVPNLMVNCKA